MRFFVSLAIIVVTWSGVALGQNWPQWRGPEGTGVSQETGLPIVWHEDRGIVWKCPLPAWGTSTPAIWKDAVFITSHTDEGKLLALRIDKESGKVVWTREVGEGEAPREAPKRQRQKFHQLHNLASPSPVTDGDGVVFHYGNGDLACYSFDGEQLWTRNLQKDHGGYTIWWGHANSPVIYGKHVISVCMQDPLDDVEGGPVESYLVAHDLKTGRIAWRQTRPTGAHAEEGDAYTTPLLWQRKERVEMVVMGGNQLDGYDPRTGKQLWHLPGLVGGRTVTGPTLAHDMVYATLGMRRDLIAVNVEGTGELHRRSIVWKNNQGTPDSCSPVVWDKWLFVVSDDGIARCFDALTGHVQWKERLKGNYKASPIVAEGRIYFLNTEGLCTVVAAMQRFDKLAENQLDARTIASPAVSQGKLFIRSDNALYCISK